MSVLGEIDPTFIQDTRIEGNLSVVDHPNDPHYYGDGSVEISGTLSVDKVKSATPGGQMSIRSPFVHKWMTTKPSLPTSGTQIYADGTLGGRIVMVNSNGKSVDLNPLTTIGDLMTYDGVKDTTVRLPSGLPDDILTCDPERNYASKLAWKTNYANVHNVASHSDGYLRYLFVQASSPLTLTNTPSSILFTEPLRVDSDAYSVALGGDGGISVSQDGIYEINFLVNVSINPDNISVTPYTNGDTVCVQTHIESSANDGVAPSTRNWKNFPLTLSESTFSTSNSVHTRCILHLTANTRLRFFVREFNTNSGVLAMKPYDCTVSMCKLDWGNGSDDEYLFTQGLQGARPSVGSDVQVIPTTTSIIHTNDGDVINSDSVTMDSDGERHILAKFSFQPTNVNVDLLAVMECRLLINGDPATDGISRCVVSGQNGNATVFINTISHIASGDILTIDSKILTSNLTSGGILVISEECALNVWKPNNSHFTRMNYRSDASISLDAIKFNKISFNNSTLTDTNYTMSSSYETVDIMSGGTYAYLYSFDVENLENEGNSSSSVMAKLSIDSGDGWKTVPGSASFTTILPGGVQNVVCSGFFFCPPNSRIRCEGLAPNGGTVQIADDTAHLSIYKYEQNIASHVGVPEFGRFYLYVEDLDDVITTSTAFTTRLSASTAYVPEGEYRLGLSYEWDMNAPGIAFSTQIVVDGSIVIDSGTHVPVTSGIYTKVTTFQRITLVNGTHTIALQSKVSEQTRSLTIRNVKIELWRI